MPRKRTASTHLTGSDFEPFDLTVYLGPQFVPWISAASRIGHVHGVPRYDPSLPSLDDLLDAVYDYADSVRFAEREPNPAIASALRHLVFGERTIVELFQATRGAAADRGRDLLVRILAAPHLAVLPWELLPDPAARSSSGESSFLALAPDAHIVRLARGRSYPVKSDRLVPPLNLLVVLSSPIGREAGDDSLAFDIYEEKRSLLAELQPLEDAGLLRIDIEERPTLENLRRRIGARRGGYHLFHYLGHAEADSLILEDDDGRRDPRSGLEFTEILRLCPDLRLAVFAGCDTARVPWDPFAVNVGAGDSTDWRSIFSLADRCVQHSCPVVVGMQAALPFRTERLFTRFFYQGLISGYSVAGAMRLARGAARGDRHIGGDLMDWSVPVLFVGGSEPGPLLERDAVGRQRARPARPGLRLGLRQRESRFFARDVALRQAVDVLSRRGSERVLIVTGPSGIGKTFLVDRALEELNEPTSILYVKLDDLILGFDRERQIPVSDEYVQKWLELLDGLDPQVPLERLCQRVTDVLVRAYGHPYIREPHRHASDWWDWIVEDLAERPFVLVIDHVDVLVQVEQLLVQQLAPLWMASCLVASTGAPEELLDELIDHLGDSAQGKDQRQSGNPFIAGLEDWHHWLGEDKFSRATQATLMNCAQRLLARVSRDDVMGEDDTTGTTGGADGTASCDRWRAGLARLLEIRRVLDYALRRIAERRSPTRLAIVAEELPREFLHVAEQWRFEMRLGHLSWHETWRWIRRNLPGLLRFGEDYLLQLWSALGPELERWEELERRVLALSSGDTDLHAIAADIAAPARASVRSASPRSRGERCLRVAMASPRLAEPSSVGRVLSRIVGLHAVGGCVIADSDRMDGGTLAILEDVWRPPLDREPSKQEILDWVEKVAAAQCDIIWVDYPCPPELRGDPESRRRLRFLRSLRHQALVIATGYAPGVRVDAEASTIDELDDVLVVESLPPDGTLAPHDCGTRRSGVPELFMPSHVAGLSLEDAFIRDAIPAPGIPPANASADMGSASMSALLAVAATMLVWSTLPSLTPRGVRQLLREAAGPVMFSDHARALTLDLRKALALARQKLLVDNLQVGPCALQPLAAITGLDLRVVSDTLDALMAEKPHPRVRMLTRGRLARYQLSAS